MAIATKKVIVCDVDGTLCIKPKSITDYNMVKPVKSVIRLLRLYKKRGFYIIVYSSRNMRTHEGNIGKIYAKTHKTMIKWLDKYKIPYDEVHLGKPWNGFDGFYVDDNTIRPSEFVAMSEKKIVEMLKKEKKYIVNNLMDK